MNETPIAAEEFAYGFDVAGLDMATLGESLRAVVAEAMSDPARISSWTADVMLADQTIGMNMLLRFMQEPVVPVATPATGDKRFSDAAWNKNPLLAGMLEGYLVRARAALKLVEGTKLPEATRRKAKFALTMLTDAVAPSNIPWVNPTVVKEAYDTGGGSLMRGMQNYLEDARSNGGKPRQVDSDSFVLGKNLAATPGRVVFRNELMELIAYEPQTARVHAVPLLCSPPWINKYYIMDLAPQRSFIEWAVRKGHQTFVISYRNPDPSMANYRLDDYLQRSLLTALDAIETLTGSPTVNLFALCLGGTMSLVLLGYLAAKGQSARVNSVTVTNTLIDFSDPGDFAVFGHPPGTHVVILAESGGANGNNPLVVSHGQQGDPISVRLSVEKAAHSGQPVTFLRLEAGDGPAPSPGPSSGNPYTPLAVDGSFGPQTTEALQWKLGVTADGQFGPESKMALQRYLKVTPDGSIGPVTIRALQAHVGATQDGSWGPQTTEALQRALNAGTF